MVIIVIRLLLEKSVFKADNKNVNFPSQFCLRCISENFVLIKLKKNLQKNVYNFSVNYNPVSKSVILNIHKDLIVKKNSIWHYLKNACCFIEF